jgi:chromosome segregation ATPase
LESKLRDAESQVRDAEAKLNDVTAKLTDVDAKYGDAQTFLSLLEKQVKDLTTEKSRLLDRIDTLEEGNERFFEMKQNQVRTSV